MSRPKHPKTDGNQASIDALAFVGVTAIVAETFQDVLDAWEEKL